MYKNDELNREGPRALRDDAQYMKFRLPRTGILMALQESNAMSRAQFWHERFGHVSIQKIRKSVPEGAITAIPLKDLAGEFQCLSCEQAKMKRKPFH